MTTEPRRQLTMDMPPLDEDIKALRGQLVIAQRNLNNLRLCGSSPVYVKGAEQQVDNVQNMINVLEQAQKVSRE